MRIAICLLILFALPGLAAVPNQITASDACGFSVRGDTAHPAVTGPEEVTALVRFIEQRDTPIEILSVDFEGSLLSVSHERFSWEPRCRIKVRNRSDKTVEKVSLSVDLRSDAGGVGGDGVGLKLAAGEATEIRACGGHGNGTARDNHVRILVYVSSVQFDGCVYRPSLSFPADLR